jgi:predicted dehydrogenase
MNKTIRWGILGTSGHARRRVMPALSQMKHATIAAVASRAAPRAEAYAKELNIGKAYGSYDALLADPDIDAVYIALPNHVHAAWSIRGAEAGKHVLCEKPVACQAADVENIILARDRFRVKIGEAFMVASHPQWLLTREMIHTGRIGEVRAIQTAFSFLLTQAGNIRNVVEFGGGALLDIGCYPVFCSRFVLGREPRRVFCTMELDPVSRVDRVTSAILDFGDVQSSFVCSFHIAPHQRMSFLATKGRLELEIPFNAPAERAARILIDDGRDLLGGGSSVIEAPVSNQFAMEFDAFSQAILKDGEVPVTLENAFANMQVLDALRRSAGSGTWETP